MYVPFPKKNFSCFWIFNWNLTNKTMIWFNITTDLARYKFKWNLILYSRKVAILFTCSGSMVTANLIFFIECFRRLSSVFFFPFCNFIIRKLLSGLWLLYTVALWGLQSNWLKISLTHKGTYYSTKKQHTSSRFNWYKKGYSHAQV